MALINGKYKVYKNENLIEHLKSWGFDDEKAKAYDSDRPTIIVELNGKNLTITSQRSEITRTSKFVVDEEIEEVFGNDTNKSLTKINGNTITISTKTSSGQEGVRIYEFTESEAIHTLKKQGLTDAKVYAKRV